MPLSRILLYRFWRWNMFSIGSFVKLIPSILQWTGQASDFNLKGKMILFFTELLGFVKQQIGFVCQKLFKSFKFIQIRRLLLFWSIKLEGSLLFSVSFLFIPPYCYNLKMKKENHPIIWKHEQHHPLRFSSKLHHIFLQDILFTTSQYSLLSILVSTIWLYVNITYEIC